MTRELKVVIVTVLHLLFVRFDDCELALLAL